MSEVNLERVQMHAGEDELARCQCTVSRRVLYHRPVIIPTECIRIWHKTYILPTTTITITNHQCEIYSFDLSRLRFNDIKMQAPQEPQAQKWRMGYLFHSLNFRLAPNTIH